MTAHSPVEYPFRHMLTTEERSLLSRPDTRRVLIDIGLLWSQIALSWAAAWHFESAWVIALSAVIVGNRYYALYIIGHDGLHRRLHDNVRANDLINDILILAPVGAITRVNRQNHMQHHRTLGRSDDPDLFKYRSREHLTVGAMLLSFTGIPLILRAAANVFVQSTPDKAPHAKHSGRDIAILLLCQGALIGGLTLAFGWWGYIVMWLLPVAMFTVSIDLLRVYVEHSVEHESSEPSLLDRLIMVESSMVERVFFSPMNMNHHVAHHLWPTIPYYNLPRATKLLEARAWNAGTPIMRRSGYCAYLWTRLLRACHPDSSPVR